MSGALRSRERNVETCKVGANQSTRSCGRPRSACRFVLYDAICTKRRFSLIASHTTRACSGRLRGEDDGGVQVMGYSRPSADDIFISSRTERQRRTDNLLAPNHDVRSNVRKRSHFVHEESLVQLDSFIYLGYYRTLIIVTMKR